MGNQDVEFTIKANVAPAVKEVEELSKKINTALEKSVSGRELKGFKADLKAISKDANELAAKVTAQKLTVGKINSLNKQLAEKQAEIADATERAAKSEKEFKDYQSQLAKQGNSTKEEEDALKVKKEAYLADKQALKDLKSERSTLQGNLRTAKDTYAKQTKYADEYLAKYKEYEEKADAILNPEAYKQAKAEADARAKAEEESANAVKQTEDSTQDISKSEEELYEQVKKTNEAFEEQQEKAKKANEEVNKTKKARNTKIPIAEDFEDDGISEDRENKILELVKTIYELRSAEKDASKETEELQKILSSFSPATADVGELARFIHDVKETSQFISSDLSNTEKLDDVFRNLAQAAVPANQAFTELTNTFKSNKMSAEAERKALQEVLEAGEYVARLNLDPTTQDFADIAQSLGILQSAKSIAEKIGIPEDVKGQYNEIVRAIERLKKAQSELKKEATHSGKSYEDAMNEQAQATANFAFAVDAVTQQVQKEFQETMQAVIDTTDRISNAMSFDGVNVSIAELIRRLTELKAAKSALEDFGLPKEMDARYEMLNQLIAKTTAQINEYKRALKETVEPAERAGKATETAGKNASKSANEFKLAAGSLKLIKNGFKDMSKFSDRVKSSFSGMARDMRSNFKHLITSLTKYVLGFRSLFFLVRRLRKYLGEGIQNLVQFEGGNNVVNSSITRLLSSLLYLKNAWAAAFAPIIEVVTPILENLIDMIAAAGNAVARFLSLLLGATVTFNAVKVPAQDYAESLGGVGDSAGGAADKVKKLTDRLAAFDDLDVLGKDNDDDNTGTGGGGGGGGGYEPDVNDMFTIVDGEFDELIEKLKQSWANADFTWLGEALRDKIIEGLDWLNNNWGEIQTIADKLGHSFGSFLVGLLGEPDLWEKSAHAIAEAFNTINIGISAFLDELDKIPFGKNAGISVNEFLQTTDWNLAGENINRVITGIVDNITDFVNTLDAQAVADAITDFLTGLDIPSVVVSVGELLLSATRLLIEVIADLMVNAGMAFGDWLTKWVSEGVKTSYVNNDGIHVQLGFELQTDWTEHPIIAMFERIANAISATIVSAGWKITLLFGAEWDLGEFIEKGDAWFESSGINDFYDSLEEGFFAIGDFINGVEVGSTYASQFNDELAHTSSIADEFQSHVSNAGIATAEMGDITAQATDTVSQGYNTASESITAYNYNVDQAIKQTNEKLNENTTTTEEWKNNTVQAAGEVSTSFSDMGDIAIGASASVGTATHDAEGNVTDMKNTVTVAVGDTANAWTDMADTVNDTGVEFSVTVDDVQASAESLPPPVVDSFSSIETGVTDSTTNIQTTLQEIWTSLSEEIPALAQTMTETMQINFNEFQVTSNVTWTNIRTDVTNRITELKTNAISLATALKTNLISIWTATKDATVNQFNLMRSGVVSNFQGLAQDIRTPANQFLSAIENMVNRSIDAINSLFEAVRKAMSMGSAWLNYMGLPEITVPANVGHVSVPRLAQGAVIPPNKEFLAVLGDQSHGTNIEAPLDTIKQAVAEVLANNNNQEVVQLLQELITVVENKDLTIGDKDIGLANARYTKRQQIIRGTSF